MKEEFIRTMQEMKGKYIKYRQDEVLLSNGSMALRDVVEHPGAVAIAAITSNKEIIMVRQYRYPVKEICFELPAGKLELGENPLDTAKRELEEEAGFRARTWTKLTSFYTAPGFTNEIIYLFLAQELEETNVNPDPDEIIEFEKIAIDKLRGKIASGEIRDAKSLIGAFLVLENRGLY